jgi:hypothetical protein
MMIAIAAGLALACAYLLKRAHDIRAENATLRNQVASLKRQLARKRA